MLHTNYSQIRYTFPRSFILVGAQWQRKEASQKEQQAGVNGSSMVVRGQWAVLVGGQASGIGYDMGNVVLLLNAMEEMWHGTFGKDSHILNAMGLGIKRDSSLLKVIITRWRKKMTKEDNISSGSIFVIVIITLWQFYRWCILGWRLKFD